MMIDAITAALNDNQNLNRKETLELFIDIFSEKEPENIDLNLLKDYLKMLNIDDDSPYQDIAGSILNELQSSDLEFYQEYINGLKSEGYSFVPFYSKKYPKRLWGVSDAPLCLYVKGDLDALSNGVAVVGTRSAHDHRIDFVKKIAKKLVEMDKVVVSGLANGVDEAAHKGALDAGGKTTAILPGQIKKIRPSSNKQLGERIPKQGALVSEVSKKKSIHKGRFVERNRITSGISSAVVIGASGETGGTIRQAEFAQKQKKPRFLYSPEKDDGQSPEKLFKKGFSSFKTVGELEHLLEKEFIPPETKSYKSLTLDDF